MREKESDWATYWRDDDLGGLELLKAHFAEHQYVPHAHEGYSIGVILDGAQDYTLPREPTELMPAGSVTAINPGRLHAGKAATEEGYTYRVLYPKPEVLERIASEMAGRPQNVPHFQQTVMSDPALARLIHRAHARLEDAQASPLEREFLLIFMLAHLIKRHADTHPHVQAPGEEKTAVRQARELLDARYDDAPSLDELASEVGLSRFYLCRVFAEEVGMPPHKYLMQVRIRRAKEKLRRGASIVQVAYATGFADQSHLTRRFKGSVGVTPGGYQRSTRR